MITFKDFLALTENALSSTSTNNVIKAWSSSAVESEEELTRVIKSHAASNIKSGPLYRGFSWVHADPNTLGFMVDTSNSQRRSLSSNNAYQAVLSLAPKMKDVPNRENSLICTTSTTTAKSYADTGIRGGLTARVIPFDGTTIAWLHSPVDGPATDVLYASAHIKFMGAQFDTMERFNTFMGSLALYFQHSKYDHISSAVIKSIAADLDAVRSADPAKAGLIVAAAYRSVYEWEDSMSASADLSNNAFELHRNWLGAFPYAQLPAEVDPKNFKIDNDPKRMYDFTVKHANPLIAAIDEITPSSWNIQTTTDPSKVPERAECWFSGQAIVIPLTSKYHDNI